MIYIRGHRHDYDRWRQLGNPGWGYHDVLPSFKKAEHNERLEDTFHSRGGPLNVADHIFRHPLSDPLADLVSHEIAPGHACQSDEALAAYLSDRDSSTIFHPIGTCKMGRDALAVVDAELKVYGLDGLRVVDASIMPTIIGGNTNAPTIMIGEKAADMIIDNQ